MSCKLLVAGGAMLACAVLHGCSPDFGKLAKGHGAGGEASAGGDPSGVAGLGEAIAGDGAGQSGGETGGQSIGGAPAAGTGAAGSKGHVNGGAAGATLVAGGRGGQSEGGTAAEAISGSGGGSGDGEGGRVEVKDPEECGTPLPASDGTSAGVLYTFDYADVGTYNWVPPGGDGLVAMSTEDAFSPACNPNPGALQFTTAVLGYGQNSFVRDVFVTPRDWTLRARVHATVKVLQPAPFLNSIRMYIQRAGGTQVDTTVYPAEVFSDGEFHDISLNLSAVADPSTLAMNGRVGVEVSTVLTPPSPGTPVDQTTILVDYVWLE